MTSLLLVKDKKFSTERENLNPGATRWPNWRDLARTTDKYCTGSDFLLPPTSNPYYFEYRDNMTVNCTGLASNQPLLRLSRQHRHQPQFDQPPATVAQKFTAACKRISINDERRDINVHYRIITSQPEAKAMEKDDSLLNTTTFSEPDFGGDISNSKGNTFTTTAAPSNSKPKTKSILRDITNRDRGGPIKGKHQKDKERKPGKVKLQVVKDKQVLEPRKAQMATKARVERSRRKGSNEAPVTFSQSEMTFFEDAQDYLDSKKFDGSVFSKSFDKAADKGTKARRRFLFSKRTEAKTPVVSNKSEDNPVTSTDDAANTTSSLTDGENSFSLDDSILSEVMPSDGKRTDDEALFLCGMKDAVMLEIHCHSNMLNAVSYSMSEVKNYLNSFTHEPKNRSQRSKTGGSKERAQRELRSSKSLFI